MTYYLQTNEKEILKQINSKCIANFKDEEFEKAIVEVMRYKIGIKINKKLEEFLAIEEMVDFIINNKPVIKNGAFFSSVSGLSGPFDSKEFLKLHFITNFSESEVWDISYSVIRPQIAIIYRRNKKFHTVQKKKYSTIRYLRIDRSQLKDLDSLLNNKEVNEAINTIVVKIVNDIICMINKRS